MSATPLKALSRQSMELPGLVDCTRCSRLVEWREAIARKPAKGFTHDDYWARPVPGFGDPNARLLILGLAPGAHGANRSGRPFTGDAAGDWLYPTLHRFGFSTGPVSTSGEDELELRDAFITNIVKCVPPQNKPTTEEARRCEPFLTSEFHHFQNVRVVLVLGNLALRSYLLWVREEGHINALGEIPFGHGAEYDLPNGHHLLVSYHCSRQNTNTGRLTRDMFESVFARARTLVDAAG